MFLSVMIPDIAHRIDDREGRHHRSSRDLPCCRSDAAFHRPAVYFADRRAHVGTHASFLHRTCYRRLTGGIIHRGIGSARALGEDQIEGNSCRHRRERSGLGRRSKPVIGEPVHHSRRGRDPEAILACQALLAASNAPIVVPAAKPAPPKIVWANEASERVIAAKSRL